MQTYPCPQKVVKLLEDTKLSLNSLRLTHACLAMVSWHPVWQCGAMLLKPELAYTVRCLDVAATAFPTGLKDHGPIHQAVLELTAYQMVFGRLEIDETSRELTFRFSEALLRTIRDSTKKDGFALLPPAQLGKLRSASQVMFYTRVELVRRCTHPVFYLPGIGQPATSWKKSCRTWRDTARTVAGMTGDVYMFSPLVERFTNNVREVAVKFSTPASRWTPGKLYVRRDRDLPTLVDISGHRKLTRSEFSERQNWTRVDGP